jgi:integrase
MLLALNTTMRAGEIRNLRWRDIDWMERAVQVRRGKTDESQREIPLNREAYEAVLKLRDQAKLVCGSGNATLPRNLCPFSGRRELEGFDFGPISNSPWTGAP